MIAIIGLAIAAVFAIMIIQRLHDNNQSAWLVLLLFIPVMNALLLLYLACAPGTPGSNRYGLKPPPNSTLNWVGGIIQLLIMTLFSGVSLLMALISS